MFSQHEYCLLCSSLNKLLVEETDHAWECWNCNVRYWIDDQSQLEICVHYGIDSDSLNDALKLCIQGSSIGLVNIDVDTGKKEQVSGINISFCMIESNE